VFTHLARVRTHVAIIVYFSFPPFIPQVRIVQNERGAARYGKWREHDFEARLETAFATAPTSAATTK